MSNEAITTITFYIGSPDEPDDKLSKSYIVKKWGHEWSLRVILDEVAKELNYISGYGIWSIKAKSEQLDFTVDYANQFKPCQEETYLHFRDMLRFNVGLYTGWRGGPVRVEIPRVHLAEGDNLFTIHRTWVGGKKQIRRYGTMYHLRMDRSDPILASFQKKLKENIFAPNVMKPWQQYSGDSYGISWWELPKTQTSAHRRDKAKKREKAKEVQQKKLAKVGIVYKDKKKKEKAHQVYIVQVNDESMQGVYKIGISNAPGKRLQALNTSNPFELDICHRFVAEPAEEAEAKLHEMFEASRLSGEWFRLTEAQIAELKKIKGYANGRFVKEEDEVPLELAQITQIANGIPVKSINYKGVEIMAIQNFGLGFNIQELNLEDVLWLYEHNQNHKDVYTTTLSGRIAGNLLDFKETKVFSVSLKFNDWSPKTTQCVDELIKRFNLKSQ